MVFHDKGSLAARCSLRGHSISEKPTEDLEDGSPSHFAAIVLHTAESK